MPFACDLRLVCGEVVVSGEDSLAGADWASLPDAALLDCCAVGVVVGRALPPGVSVAAFGELGRCVFAVECGMPFCGDVGQVRREVGLAGDGACGHVLILSDGPDSFGQRGGAFRCR